jgi:cellulose synthase/poly-beta-1,6-N-acetylglucosamine synthase-like glycosyltransferase
MASLPNPTAVMFLLLAGIHFVKRRLTGEATISATNGAALPSYTAIIPARNEAETLGLALESLANQSHQPSKVIVLDDCSDDDYSDIVKKSYPSAEIRRFDPRRGKAANINTVLPEIADEYVLVLDADTYLDRDYAKKLLNAGDFDIVYGTLLPDLRRRGIFTAARLVEYLYGHTVWKQATALIGASHVTGCFTIYKTSVLRQLGGYPCRTVTEDTDLTWLITEKGGKILYVPEARGYTKEPSNFKQFSRQIKRWHTGFWQTLKVHGQRIGESNSLTLLLDVVMLDTFFFAFVLLAFLLGSFLDFFLRFSLLNALSSPLQGVWALREIGAMWFRWFPFATNVNLALLTLIVDFGLISTISLVQAKRLGLVRRALIGLPAFYILSWYSRLLFWRAFLSNLRFKPSMTSGPRW